MAVAVSVPVLLLIVAAAVAIGVVLGRRRVRAVRPADEAGIRVIRPPSPAPAQPAPVVGPAMGAADASALADAINRASDAAHKGVHVTPDMLAGATVMSDVQVTTGGGALDPASARTVMAAVTRALEQQGGGVAGLAPDVEAEVRALIARGQAINAIKRVREATGLDLKHAKDLVDSMS